MADYEDLLRQDTKRRGWTLEVRPNRLSVGGVPYRKKDGVADKCQIIVETQNDGLTMKAPRTFRRSRPCCEAERS